MNQHQQQGPGRENDGISRDVDRVQDRVGVVGELREEQRKGERENEPGEKPACLTEQRRGRGRIDRHRVGFGRLRAQCTRDGGAQ